MCCQLLLSIPDCPFILRPLRHVQVSIPLWALVHLPVVVTITTAIFTPRVRLSARVLALLAGHGLLTHCPVATPVTLCSCPNLVPICAQWITGQQINRFIDCRAGCTASCTCSSRTPWAS